MNATPSQTVFRDRIRSGKSIVTAELMPPSDVAAKTFMAALGGMRGKIDAVGVSDNRSHIGISSLAAAVLAADCGIEPIMHLVTRDRNRIALLSEVMGARALGIRNILVTSGTHQTLGSFRASRNVYDLDPVQLLRECSGHGGMIEAGASVHDGDCLGVTASPFSDPEPLQRIRLAKKVAMGASFVVTQPVFDAERFAIWWETVAREGLHEKTAVMACIEPLLTGEQVRRATSMRPNPRIPAPLLERLLRKSDGASARAEGIAVAVETIGRLRTLKGLRGFDIRCDDDCDTALEIIEKSGLMDRD